MRRREGEHALISSVSIVSLSFSVAWGRMIAGGASITGVEVVPFFFLAPSLGVKNDPKKLGSSFLGSTSRSLLLLIWFLTALGSTAGGGGLEAAIRSWTIVIAWGGELVIGMGRRKEHTRCPLMKSGCVVFT